MMHESNYTNYLNDISVMALLCLSFADDDTRVANDSLRLSVFRERETHSTKKPHDNVPRYLVTFNYQ